MYLFSWVLLMLRVQGLQHFALIQLPHWIHSCTNVHARISLFKCLLLLLPACFGWTNFKLFPCVRRSAAEQRRNLF